MAVQSAAYAQVVPKSPAAERVWRPRPTDLGTTSHCAHNHVDRSQSSSFGITSFRFQILVSTYARSRSRSKPPQFMSGSQRFGLSCPKHVSGDVRVVSIGLFMPKLLQAIASNPRCGDVALHRCS